MRMVPKSGVWPGSAEKSGATEASPPWCLRRIAANDTTEPATTVVAQTLSAPLAIFRRARQKHAATARTRMQTAVSAR